MDDQDEAVALIGGQHVARGGAMDSSPEMSLELALGSFSDGVLTYMTYRAQGSQLGHRKVAASNGEGWATAVLKVT
jgi:hypothetical protein